jgi:predicted nucleic acid-binding protein
MIVIADTGPVNYLVLIQMADLLPRLFGQVLIPLAVVAELRDPATPDPVRAWIANAPAWLQVRALRLQPDPRLYYLDEASGRPLPWPRN